MRQFLMILTVGLALAKPTYSQVAKNFVVDSIQPRMFFEFNERYFAHCWNGFPDVVYEIKSDGDFVESVFDMERVLGPDSILVTMGWKTGINHVFSYGFVDSYENGIIIREYPQFRGYDKNLNKVIDFVYPDSTSLWIKNFFQIEEDVVCFVVKEWDWTDPINLVVNNDSIVLLKVRISDSSLEIQKIPSPHPSLGFDDMDHFLLSGDKTAIIAKTYFGANQERAYRLNIQTGQSENIDISFNAVATFDNTGNKTAFIRNPIKEEKQYLFSSNEPIREGDGPFDPQNPDQKKDYLYFLNEQMEIVQYSVLMDSEYYFSYLGISEKWAAFDFFNDTIEGLSAIDFTSLDTSHSPHTGEKYSNGFFYFKKVLETNEVIERRFLSREDALGDFSADLVYNQASTGGVFFEDTGAVYLRTNPPNSVNYLERSLFSIPLNDMTLALPQESGNLHIEIYPNPTQEKLQVLSKVIGELRILNSSGQAVKELQLSGNALIDVQEFGSGVYFLEVTNTESRTSVFRFVKE